MGSFDDRIYLELTLSKSLETDAAGNYIVYAEASNENLDFQDQVVLQRALLDSKDYFLKNGVISWDHLHLKTNDPSYIIGEPLGVEKRGGKTFVKAMLYKGNKIVEDLVSKLKNGSTVIKTSVGGKRPVVVQDFDTKLRKPIEKIVSVLWDELAITFKPVNQTLSPVALSSSAFVKSLSAGYSTDSATATGGAALIPQDLEGDKKSPIHAVITAIAVGDVRTPKAGREVLAEFGIESKEADDILTEVVNRRKKLQEVFRMDANLSKSFEDAISDLEKALKPGAPAPVPAPAPAPAPAPMPYDEPDDDNMGGPSDGDDDNMDDDEEPMAPPAPPMKKSNEPDEDVEFLDVSPILSSMAKSLKRLRADNADLRKSLASQDALIKSLANTQLQSAMVLKSLTDTPAMRKSVLNRQDRFQGSGNQGAIEMSAGEILRKSTVALEQGKITLREATILEDRVNKGMDVPAEMLAVLKSL
jgi:hypothetical protein